MSSFEFMSDDIFPIYQRGIVFRGTVNKGEAIEGDIISFKTLNGIQTAEISLIECERKVLNKTVLNKELGILLKGFSLDKSNNAFIMLPENEEEESTFPTIEQQLNITLPIILKK